MQCLEVVRWPWMAGIEARSRSSRANASQHIPSAAGNLLWAITGTCERTNINLTLDFASVLAPGGITVSIP